MDPVESVSGAVPIPFVIDVSGMFAPEFVRVRFDPSPRPTTAELDALIDAEWRRRIAEARRTDRVLFNGDLFRYLRHAVLEEEGGRVFELTVGPTCYRDFVGTNLYNHRRLDEFGWRRFANPIGTTATLLTRDGKICYGRRSNRVAYHAGHVHTFGGGFEARDRDPDGTIDPFGSVCRELREELNLDRAELYDLCCVGLIHDREIHQPEMLFEARLELDAAQLVDRWRTAEARDEHDEIVSLADEPAALVPFIRSCGQIAPVAIGALLLHGRRRWGDAWFQDAGRSLAPATPAS